MKNILKNQIFNKFIFILKNIIQIININVDNIFIIPKLLLLMLVINLSFKYLFKSINLNLGTKYKYIND